MKILTVVGARPQFIKAAALSRAIRSFPAIVEIIAHTGQHFDQNMSDIFFEEMEIPVPHYNLNIHGLSHGAMTGQMLEGIEKIVLEEKPEYVLVYGDTNSTLAGALAAKKLHINVIHVEAGLRSHNMYMPEEINRILTDRISDILFCPTQVAINNLKREGFENLNAEIILSGDIMQDAAIYYQKKSEQHSYILSRYNLNEEAFVLATLHRAENTDDDIRLKNIIYALNEINETLPVIVPIHPRTSKILEHKNVGVKFLTIPPVGYIDMLQLISHSKLILTDSGGLQKEAYFFNKFCITLRNETEWVELVEHGYNQIVGASPEKIIKAFNESIKKVFTKTEELYGGGEACELICNEIIRLHNGGISSDNK
jgi:UDP-GlcNAc3NAcA epimerase